MSLPPVVRLALSVLLNHVEPGWENCRDTVKTWLDHSALAPIPPTQADKMPNKYGLSEQEAKWVSILERAHTRLDALGEEELSADVCGVSDEIFARYRRPAAPSPNAQSELVIPEWIEKQMGPGFKNMYDHNNWTLTVGAIRAMRGLLFDKTKRITELEQRIRELEQYERAWHEWRSLQTGDVKKLFDAALRCESAEAALAAHSKDEPA